MILFRAAGSFLLVMAFFSVGAVMGSRKKSIYPHRAPSPGRVDVAAIILCWLAALAASISGYRTLVATAIGAGTGLFAAFILHRLRRETLDVELKSTGKTFETGKDSSAPGHPREGGPFRTNWRSFAQEVGGYQSRLLLDAFYFVAVMPFGIVVGNLGDPLKVKVPPRESFWSHREVGDENLDTARRQY